MMARDNWQHRSEGMRCKTCMWYAPKITVQDGEMARMLAGEATEQVDHERVFGRCRRHAPTMAGYPAVFGDDWCGDHKLDEASI